MSRSIITLAAFTALAVPLTASLAWADDVCPNRGGTVSIIQNAGAPANLNGAVRSGTATGLISTQIFASPLRYDENWNPQPYLAKSWDVSADGLSITLHLVDNALFQDGTPVTSEDVAYSIMLIKNNHPFQTMLAPVQSVDTPDPHTAVVRLSHPHPALLLAMSPALMPILPKHYFDDGADPKTSPKNVKPIGSGPFKLTEFKQGEYVILDRFDKFFMPGRPCVDRLVYTIMEDGQQIDLSLENGEQDIAGFISGYSDLERLGKAPNLAISDKGYQAIGPINWISFNTAKKPLDDKRVREAISYVIDRGFITKTLMRGTAEIATGPIVPGSPFYSADVNPYKVDIDKANQLLDEAGYKAGADGKRFSITVDFEPVPDIPGNKGIAEYVRQQLQKVGVDLELRPGADFDSVAQHVSNFDYDLDIDQVFNWADPVIGVHRTYLSTNIRKGVMYSNTEGYNNPKVDELLKAAALENDPAKRKALYAEFQKIVVDDVPVAFLNVVPYHSVYNKNLGNPPTTIWGLMSPLDDLYWKNPPK